MKLEVLYIIAI